MSAFRKVMRSAGVIGVSTLMSRILGLVRDMVMTYIYGAGLVADAFYVAWMIPALMRRLVGEGSLTVAFIPVFTKFRQEHGEDEARRLLSSFGTLLVVILAGMVLLGMVFSREIVYVFTNPAFRADTEKFDLAVTMARQMFPYLFFISLTALAMGVLNSYKHFFAPAFHPVLLNVAWITAAVLLHGGFHESGLAVVIGVLIGGVLQLSLQIPVLAKFGVSFMPRFNFRHPAIKRIALLMLPSTFAVGIVQFNTLISTYFITRFDGARSQLFYANRWTEFPYAIFSLAIATAILPLLSEQAGTGDRKAFRETLGQGLGMVAFITIPASLGLALLARPLIHIFYEHGAFTAMDTSLTSTMLEMFCIGLWAVAALRIVVQAFYAVEDMRTPLYAAIMAMVVNALLCWFLSARMGRAGVPLAISLSSIANLLVLWVRLPAKVGAIDYKALLRTTGLTTIACAPMAAYVFALTRLPVWAAPGRVPVKALVLVAMVAGGAALFTAAAWMLKTPELGVFLDAFKRRLKGAGKS